MTRIIAGSARGRRLRTPPGNHTRPTADRVREALFSALESELGTVAGVRFLDLFAGSGAVGLEACSRGASAVVLVEADRATAALIRANARELGFDEVAVHAAKTDRWVSGLGSPGIVGTGTSARTGSPGVRGVPDGFDVVYVDPPYATEPEAVTDILTGLVRSGRLAEDAVVVVERSRRGTGWEWPVGLEGVREKRYGETMLFYGRVTGPAEPPAAT